MTLPDSTAYVGGGQLDAFAGEWELRASARAMQLLDWLEDEIESFRRSVSQRRRRAREKSWA